MSALRLGRSEPPGHRGVQKWAGNSPWAAPGVYRSGETEPVTQATGESVRYILTLVLLGAGEPAWLKKVVFGVTRLEFAGQLAKGGFGQITAAYLAKTSADATPTPINTCAGARCRRGIWPYGARAGQTLSAERNGAYSGCYPHRNHAGEPILPAQVQQLKGIPAKPRFIPQQRVSTSLDPLTRITWAGCSSEPDLTVASIPPAQHEKPSPLAPWLMTRAVSRAEGFFLLATADVGLYCIVTGNIGTKSRLTRVGVIVRPQSQHPPPG